MIALNYWGQLTGFLRLELEQLVTSLQREHRTDGRHGNVTATGLTLTLPTYATDAAAVAGGLKSGQVYQTATGELRITL